MHYTCCKDIDKFASIDGDQEFLLQGTCTHLDGKAASLLCIGFLCIGMQQYLPLAILRVWPCQ